MDNVRNPARERLERGELSLGVGVRIAKTVEIAKAMKTAGFDWLFIDLEHGALSIDTAAQIAVAALDAGIAPIARVPNGEFSMATRSFNGINTSEDRVITVFNCDSRKFRSRRWATSRATIFSGGP